MDEIVVSARVREQDLQSVPVAVSAITLEEINRLNIDDLGKIAKYNSSVIFDQGFASQDTRITLRGLAPTRGRQNVAVLVDGVDISTSQALQTNGGGLLLNPRLFDLERIEVVKGPQNALYGRTAFAGAINYISKTPGDVLEANFSVDGGDNGQFEFRAGIRGPLTDTLSLGLNVAGWEHDGYYDNSVTGNSVGGIDGKGFSGTLVWDALDTLTAKFYTEYTNDGTIDQAPYFAITPTTPVPIPTSAIGTVISPGLPTINAVRGSFPDGSDSRVTLSENPRDGRDYPGSDREIWRTTLTVNAEFTDRLELVSQTHYANTDSESFEDSRREGSVSDPTRTVGGEFYVKDHLDLFSQELRLQSFGNDVVDWAVGGLFWQEKQDFTDAGINCVANEIVAPPPFGAPGVNCAAPLASFTDFASRFPDPWDRDTTHWSVYGLFEWQFAQTFRLLLEARYSDEDVKIKGPDRVGDPGAGDAARPRAIDPRGISFPATLDPAYGRIKEQESDRFFSPKVTLQWTPTNDMMYYFSVAGSTKPDGISITGALTGFDPAASTFSHEELTVWELGAKTSWLDNRLILNGAVFYQDFDDKLVTSQRPDASGVLFPAPVNASEAEVWGVELDAVWQVFDSLTLRASYTYLDTEYEDYTQLSSGPAPIADAGNCTVTTDAGGDTFCTLDLSNNDLEFSPENSFIIGFDFRQELMSTGFDWFLESDVIYQDERWTSAFNTMKLDDYTVVDFRFGVANDAWEALVYVDNAFDDDTVQSTFANTYNQGIGFIPFPPPSTFVLPLNQTPILPNERQWGVRVNYRFSAK